MVDAPQPNDHLHTELKPKRRSEFARDRDRIIYSSAFQRLAGITQVTSPEAGLTFHNRLTHTLKVGQMSRRMAEDFKERFQHLPHAAVLDPDAAEACALAHDLGHPPFGHLGERVLDRLARGVGCEGFEANAQSFRVVTRLAMRAIAYPGLNLTRLTLNGILKYPWMATPAEEKAGAYSDDAEAFVFALALSPVGCTGFESQVVRQRSLEAEIMDWADDITYAVHDLEDFYKAGLIPIADLVRRPEARREFMSSWNDPDNPGHLRKRFAGVPLADAEVALERILGEFALGLARSWDGSKILRAIVRTASSELIGRFYDAMEPTAPTAAQPSLVAIEPGARAQVTVLKELLWYYVIDRPSLATIQEGQAKVLEQLHARLIEAAASTASRRLFPVSVREQLDDHPATDGSGAADSARGRIVTDYIAGMNEAEVWALHRRLSGIEPDTLAGLHRP